MVSMTFPLNLSDLSLWLAATAIILLVTVELIPPDYQRKGPINYKRLERIALIIGVLFVITVVSGIFL